MRVGWLVWWNWPSHGLVFRTMAGSGPHYLQAWTLSFLQSCFQIYCQKHILTIQTFNVCIVIFVQFMCEIMKKLYHDVVDFHTFHDQILRLSRYEKNNLNNFVSNIRQYHIIFIFFNIEFNRLLFSNIYLINCTIHRIEFQKKAKKYHWFKRWRNNINTLLFHFVYQTYHIIIIIFNIKFN